MTHTEVVLSKKRDINAYEENLYSNLEDLKRMSRMIDDMLFLAKADNGLIIPEQARIELADVVFKLFDYYHLLAEEHGIELSLTGTGQVLGDRLMLDRALSNLLSNALRYTPVGHTISVLIRETADSTTFSIENPGDTISSEHLEKLFDRFYRVDPARREEARATPGSDLPSPDPSLRLTKAASGAPQPPASRAFTSNCPIPDDADLAVSRLQLNR